MFLGELSIVQVILSSSYNDERTVSRVAVLGLDQSSANHLFRCSSSTIALSQLEWVKDGQPVKFRTVLLSSHLLMDMTDPKVQEEDQGDYTCRDSVTLEGLTISIRAGEGWVRGWSLSTYIAECSICLSSSLLAGLVKLSKST